MRAAGTCGDREAPNLRPCSALDLRRSRRARQSFLMKFIYFLCRRVANVNFSPVVSVCHSSWPPDRVETTPQPANLCRGSASLLIMSCGPRGHVTGRSGPALPFHVYVQIWGGKCFSAHMLQRNEQTEQRKAGAGHNGGWKP